MRFPLDQRVLIRGCEEHIEAGLGCAADYRAVYTDLYAPVDGYTYIFGSTRSKGGLWIGVKGDDGYDYQFAHMYKRYNTGRVKEGEHIGITGNSGTLTSGPHLHAQIFKDGRRIDPERHFSTKPSTTPAKEEDVNVDELAGEYSNILARVWQDLNGKPPVMDSINREARDAAERRKNGETYAANSYVDKYFSEAPKSSDAERVKEKAIQIEELALAKLKEI